MKTLRVFFVLCIFVLHSVTAEDFNIPPEIDLFQYQMSKEGSYYRKPNDGGIFDLTDVRIWGWSKDGKVAYSIDHEIDGRGGNYIQFFVMNMITDEIVFTVDSDFLDYEDKSYNSPTERFYIENGSALKNAMQTHRIEEYQRDFLPFPFSKDNVEYNCFAEIKRLQEPEYYDPLLKYDVIISRNGRKKIIRTVPEVRASEIYVCGYFMSPFENRALIVTAEEQFVFEGTELFYNFSGCHLNIGFE